MGFIAMPQTCLEANMDSIDFLPERIRAERARRRRLIREGYLVAAVAVGLVLLGYLRQGQIRQASAELAVLNSQSDQLQAQVASKKQLEEQMQDLDIKKRVEEHLGSRISPELVLAELQKLLPESIFLKNLSLEIQEVQADNRPAEKHISARLAAGGSEKAVSDGIKRLQLVIVGMAPSDVDLVNFIAQLSTSPLFENVNMGYTKTVLIDNHVAQEFKASCLVAK